MKNERVSPVMQINQDNGASAVSDRAEARHRVNARSLRARLISDAPLPKTVPSAWASNKRLPNP